MFFPDFKSDNQVVDETNAANSITFSAPSQTNTNPSQSLLDMSLQEGCEARGDLIGSDIKNVQEEKAKSDIYDPLRQQQNNGNKNSIKQLDSNSRQKNVPLNDILSIEGEKYYPADHSNNASKSTSTWQVMGEQFELSSNYKVIEYLGAGAYGVVASCHNSIDNTTYAIKKCKKIFYSRTLAKRTLRELRLLRLLEHNNIIKIKTILTPTDLLSFDSLYVVFELLETDLAQIIRSPQVLTDQHIQYFTFQILAALQYLHSNSIVHRDLKPRNLLVNGDCHLKIADFGLARLYGESSEGKIVAMTEYVTTRWYRAPEILVGWKRYTFAIDLWSVGCIIAELIGRTPIFPGSDSLKQVDLICKYLGKPEQSFIDQSRKNNYREYLNELQLDSDPVDFSQYFSGANPGLLTLMKSFLRFDPLDRPSAESSLKSPYLKSMPKYRRYNGNNNTKINSSMTGENLGNGASLSLGSILAKEFLFESKKLSSEGLRQELLNEVKIQNCSEITQDGFVFGVIKGTETAKGLLKTHTEPQCNTKVHGVQNGNTCAHGSYSTGFNYDSEDNENNDPNSQQEQGQNRTENQSQSTQGEPLFSFNLGCMSKDEIIDHRKSEEKNKRIRTDDSGGKCILM